MISPINDTTIITLLLQQGKTKQLCCSLPKREVSTLWSTRLCFGGTDTTNDFIDLIFSSIKPVYGVIQYQGKEKLVFVNEILQKNGFHYVLI